MINKFQLQYIRQNLEKKHQKEQDEKNNVIQCARILPEKEEDNWDQLDWKMKSKQH